MALTIDIMDGNGFSNKTHCKHLPKKSKMALAVLVTHFIVAGVSTVVHYWQDNAFLLIEVTVHTQSEAFKRWLDSSYTKIIGLLALTNILLLLSFVTKAIILMASAI